MIRIPGIGPDAPKTSSALGGKQSATPYRFDLIDPLVVFRMAELLSSGAKEYGVDNWRAIDAQENLNHALQHIFAFLGGDESEGEPWQHLTHALCRIHFALGVELQGGPVAARETVNERPSPVSTVQLPLPNFDQAAEVVTVPSDSARLGPLNVSFTTGRLTRTDDGLSSAS